MKKEEVCVFISNEDELQEMREFLESKGELIATDETFNKSCDSLDYLKYYNNLGFWSLGLRVWLKEITKEDFKLFFE